MVAERRPAVLLDCRNIPVVEVYCEDCGRPEFYPTITCGGGYRGAGPKGLEYELPWEPASDNLEDVDEVLPTPRAFGRTQRVTSIPLPDLFPGGRARRVGGSSRITLRGKRGKNE